MMDRRGRRGDLAGRLVQVVLPEGRHLAVDGAMDEQAGDGHAGQREGDRRADKVDADAQRAAPPHCGSTPSR